MNARRVVTWAAVAALFIFGFWLTSAEVSDEEIRPTPVASQRAQH